MLVEVGFVEVIVVVVVVVVEVNIGYVVAYVWDIFLGSGLIIIRCMFEFAIGFNH